MTVSENKIYPRTGDKQTVYLKPTITKPNIEVGDYTIYNDFENDPVGFEKNKTELRDKVNEGLKEMNEDGTFAKISEKYFGENVSILK